MVYNFFIFCSGADRDILSECPRFEKNKYAAIGATVFLTGILAAISSGYALFTIFRGEEYAITSAIGFGLLWAFVIFNLDRYIVSSLRKEGNWKKELLHATPRFIIAVLISLVIAKPLEVRIFASRIEQQILEDKRNKLEEEKLATDKYTGQTKLENQIQTETAQIEGLETLKFSDPPTDDFQNLLTSRNQASVDFNKTSQNNNIKIADYNSKINAIISDPTHYIKDDSLDIPTNRLLPEYNQQRKNYNYSKSILSNEIKQKLRKVTDLDAEIKKARSDYQALIAQKINDAQADLAKTKTAKLGADSMAETQIKESIEVKQRSYTNNFITQVEALGNMNSTRFTTMWWTSILIMLLFITIETAPIVVKLLSKRGPYDERLERIEYEHYLEQQKIISDRNDEINNLLTEIRSLNKLKGEVRMKTEQSKLDAELKANNALLDEIAKRQADLAKIAIDKWYKEELAKFADNSSNSLTQSKNSHSQVPPSLEDKLWKAMNLQDEVYYLFKNGQPTINELIYIEGGKTEKGTWEYVNDKKTIKVTILNNEETYQVLELSEANAKLSTANKDLLELVSV